MRRVIISCEHAVNTIPKEYAALFSPFEKELNTHQGIDFGALTIAQHLAKTFGTTCIQTEVSRLLIDCNRSLHHKNCFSKISKNLSKSDQKRLIEKYYLPFRHEVEQKIQNYIHQGDIVWHFSIHSFTPIWNNVLRTTDIGLLYDPKKTPEKTLAKNFKKMILLQNPLYRVRFNYPYLGISDGHTTYLRKKFSPSCYIGIEIESNQALTMQTENCKALQKVLSASLLLL